VKQTLSGRSSGGRIGANRHQIDVFGKTFLGLVWAARGVTSQVRCDIHEGLYALYGFLKSSRFDLFAVNAPATAQLDEYVSCRRR